PRLAEGMAPPSVSGDARPSDPPSRCGEDHGTGISQTTLDLQPAASKASLAVVDGPRTADPPSPYKRSRRRSLASIFKFGNGSTTHATDQSTTHSKSRVDLTSPTFPSERSGAAWDQSPGDHLYESDWDQLNSPSDIPGRNAYSHRPQRSNVDLPHSSDIREPQATNGIPIPTGKRRGSTKSRDVSVSRYGYSSASASAASLANSSVYGSAASQFSLHEAFGGRGAQGRREEDDKRRLKKPQSKAPRRPPSASGRRSKHSYSPSRQLISPTSSGITSPNLDLPQHTTRSSSRHSHLTEGGIPMASSSARSTSRSQQPPPSSSSMGELSQPILALTPENIVPLLVYAKEVRSKLADCLLELKALESDLLLSKPSRENDILDNGGAIEIETNGTRW
ncbi:hypothetical protein FRC17_008457, partial [Serendipita sp. 399]